MIHVWVVDSLCVFAWTTSLDFSLFVTSCHWVCAYWNLDECSFFQVFLKHWLIIQFQLNQFLYQGSMQQRRKYFLPYRTLLFSLHPGSLYSHVFLLVIFPFLFYRCHTILSKPNGLVSSFDISFHLSTFSPCGLGPFWHTLHMSIILGNPSSVIFIFLTFEASHILFNSLEVVASLHFFGNMGLIKCQNVRVDLNLLTTLSDCNSFDVCHAPFS